MSDGDRIHRNAVKAMSQWHDALTDYKAATQTLEINESGLRAIRRDMKDIETDTFLAGGAAGITGKNADERKAQLAVALRNNVVYQELTDSEAAYERSIASARQAADVAQETMKMAAAVLRYATEERREVSERLATERVA